MRRVIIESPYSGKIARNTAYARLCLLDSLKRNEAPLASHLLYPQMLDEGKLWERQKGIRAGFAWMDRAELVVLYRDFGLSNGMLVAFCEAQNRNIPILNRYLLDTPDTAWMSETDKEVALHICWWQRWLGLKPRLPDLPGRYQTLAPSAGAVGPESSDRKFEPEPGTLAHHLKYGARTSGSTENELIGKERSDDPAYINQVLSRNAPLPLPWGEPTTEK